MAEKPTYEQWMKATHSALHKRSDYLKKLDETIKTGKNDKVIKEALDRWKFDQSSKGKDWTKSVRNKKGAVTNLYRAVNDLDKRSLSEEEREAMKYICHEQKMALTRQFEGKEVSFKSNTLIGLKQGAGDSFTKFKTALSLGNTTRSNIKGVSTDVKSVRDGMNKLRKGGRALVIAEASGEMNKKIRDLCKSLTPGMDPDKVFANLNLGSVSQFSTNIAPFVGAISSGGKAIVGWIGVAKTAYKKYDIEDKRHAFAPDDPEAAFDAVLVLLKRDITSQSAKAGVATAAFTGKLLGAFADAGAVTGPAIGILETLASIFQTIVEYVRDYKEVEKANELLRVGYLNLDLFNECPILGCYFLLIQDHSTIINFAVADYGTANFVFDAERLVGKINPVLDQARTYVHASRFEIVGFDAMKGVVEKNWSKQDVKGKITGLPAHLGGKVASLPGQVKDKIHGMIVDRITYPKKQTEVVTGISSTGQETKTKKWR